MHTSFEDISLKNNHEGFRAEDGNILRMDENGNWIWERPRTRHEAGYRRSLAVTLLAGIGLGVPLAIALVFILT